MAVSSMQPPSPSMRLWLNGSLVEDPNAPALSPVDHGVVVGDGVFEALKVTAAGPYSVQRHLDRLTRSSRALGLPDPDHGQVREGIAAVIADRSYELGKIRITWTGGLGPLGSPPAYGPATLIVAADGATPADPVGRIITVPWRRNDAGAMTGVKTTSYAENVRALKYAYDRDATEGIFLSTSGVLSEGTGSNIFCIFGERVVTPPMSAGILDGITRRLLLEWVDGIEETDLSLEEAQAADEVFITSSLRDVQAVDRWDDVTYDAPGAVTKRIAETFAERCEADPEP